MEVSMWHKVLLVILLLIFSGCAARMTGIPSSESQEDMVFPEWFWHSPRLESGIAVGYSPSYYYPKEAIAAAELNGVETLAKQMSVRIKGGKAYMKDHKGIHFAGEKIEELFAEESYNRLKKNHYFLDKHVSKGCTIVLVSTEDIPISNEPRAPGLRPKWVNRLPKEDGCIYATGQCARGMYSANSWLMAERNARIELAMSVETKLQGMSKRLGYWSNGTFISEVDVVLDGIQIVKRWYDSEMKVCHVLARVPITKRLRK